MTDIKSILSIVPTVLGFVSMFIPAIKPFIPVIEAAIAAVETVMSSTAGTDLATAIAAVTDHLTPGKPDAAVLSQNSAHNVTNNANQGS